MGRQIVSAARLIVGPALLGLLACLVIGCWGHEPSNYIATLAVSTAATSPDTIVLDTAKGQGGVSHAHYFVAGALGGAFRNTGVAIITVANNPGLNNPVVIRLRPWNSSIPDSGSESTKVVDSLSIKLVGYSDANNAPSSVPLRPRI